jgi:hypothetical protein
MNGTRTPLGTVPEGRLQTHQRMVPNGVRVPFISPWPGGVPWPGGIPWPGGPHISLANSPYSRYTRNKGEKHPLFSRTIISAHLRYCRTSGHPKILPISFICETPAFSATMPSYVRYLEGNYGKAESLGLFLPLVITQRLSVISSLKVNNR